MHPVLNEGLMRITNICKKHAHANIQSKPVCKTSGNSNIDNSSALHHPDRTAVLRVPKVCLPRLAAVAHYLPQEIMVSTCGICRMDKMLFGRCLNAHLGDRTSAQCEFSAALAGWKREVGLVIPIPVAYCDLLFKQVVVTTLSKTIPCLRRRRHYLGFCLFSE